MLHLVLGYATEVPVVSEAIVHTADSDSTDEHESLKLIPMWET